MVSDLFEEVRERDTAGRFAFHKISIEPTNKSWMTHIARNIRTADRIELWAGYRVSPYEAIRLSVESGESAVFLHSGVPFAIGGVSGPVGEAGSPWLLATDGILLCPRGFAECSRLVQASFDSRHPYLENHVHSRNHLSIRWLKWLGYKVSEALTDIGEGKFRKFSKENPSWAM